MSALKELYTNWTSKRSLMNTRSPLFWSIWLITTAGPFDTTIVATWRLQITRAVCLPWPYVSDLWIPRDWLERHIIHFRLRKTFWIFTTCTLIPLRDARYSGKKNNYVVSRDTFGKFISINVWTYWCLTWYLFSGVWKVIEKGPTIGWLR